MALDLATLITDIQDAFNDGIGVDDNALQISTDIATAVDTYLKSGLEDATAGGDPVGPGQTVVA